VSDFPFHQNFELGRLGQAGAEVTVAPSKDDLARIAQWVGVEAVEAFSAKVALKRVSQTRFSLDAALEADIVQACVVTLEPVKGHIIHSFHRDLFLTQAPQALEIDLAPVDDDGREEIDNLRYDLAMPLLEELALAIDPYPRAPGVAFEPPPDKDPPEHPFAALKALKKGE
jgi:uncharacterized metal-binding protein YceD (DUF177 family)